jgi:hypothetical protein
MKISIKELEPLEKIANEQSVLSLENFLINTNLSTTEREKLVNIIVGMIVPIIASEKNLEHLG